MAASSHRLDHALLACGFGPILFVAVLLIESFTRPGYDPLHRFGSELANGDRGWTMITAFVVAGALTIAFAVGLRRTQRPVVGPILVGLFGFGLVVGGVFVIDPKPGYPADSTPVAEPSLQGSIHDANLFATWIVMAAAMVVYSRHGSRDKRLWTGYTLATVAVTLTTLAIALAIFESETQTGQWHGVWQRISIFVAFIWFGALAIRVRHQTPAADS